MANTRKSTKRAGQAKKRQARNVIIRSATKSALRDALAAIQAKDVAKAKEAYMAAVKALSKAASKGGIPQGRAARKISRLTLFVKKTLPGVVPASK
jgi:small subunit ribosomal protein S20